MSGGIHILILAAGASRRMRGDDKLLRQIEGEPLLQRTARQAVESKAQAVHVVVPAGHHEREGVLAGSGVSIVPCRDWREGMGASLRAGIAMIPEEASAVIVSLADMPDITAAHYNALIEAFAATASDVRSFQILRAVTASGRVGHPVLFGKAWLKELVQVSGDHGARGILQREKRDIVLVPTEGEGAVTDLDTPEAWASWVQVNLLG